MKLLLIAVSVFIFSSNAFAKRSPTFGVDVSLKDLKGISPRAVCSSGALLQKVFKENGVNVVDDKVGTQRWRCDGSTSQRAGANRCPYPQYSDLPGKKLTCFSNGPRGVAVCVGDPSSHTLEPDGKYANRLTQPRFKELHIIGKNSRGNRDDKSYKMDSAGCTVESVRGFYSKGLGGGTENTTFEGCVESFNNLRSGGPISPSYSKKVKFCQKRKRNTKGYVSDLISGTRDLSRCLEEFPNFERRYMQIIKPKDQKRSWNPFRRKVDR